MSVQQIVVVPDGRHAGLYVNENDKHIAYVKNETRPYAEPFENIIYDTLNNAVFYT